MPTMTLNRRPASADLAIDWIRSILDEKNWSATELARKADLVPSTILRMLNDPNHRFTPSMKTMQSVARASRMDIPDHVIQGMLGKAPVVGRDIRTDETQAVGTSDTGKGSDAPVERPAPKQEASVRLRPASVAGEVKAPVRMLSVQYVSSLPKSLHPSISSEAKVACPPQLMSDETAFAFYMPDNTLLPVIKSSNLLYGTRSREPVVNDLILVTDVDGRSKVRTLYDINDQGLVVGRGMRDDDETIPFDKIGDGGLALIAGLWML